MYTKTVWVDRVVDPTTGEVVQQGTPLSATNLNNLENGVTAICEQCDDIASGEIPVGNADNGFSTYTHSTTTDDDGIVTHYLTDAGANGKFKATASGTITTAQVGTTGDYTLCTIVSGDDTELEIVEGRWYQFILDGSVLNFTSGGTSLKYKVIASTTEPDNPTNGMIWVVDETPVLTVQIGVAEPTTRANGTALQEGDIFLVVGSSTTAISSASGNIVLPITFVQQYNGTSWSTVNAYMYAANTWVNQIFYIYYDNVDFIFGGVDFSAEKTQYQAQQGNTIGTYVLASTTIDVTYIDTVYLAYSGLRMTSDSSFNSAYETGNENGYFTRVHLELYVGDQNATVVRGQTTGTAGTLSWDISALTGLQTITVRWRVVTYSAADTARVSIGNVWAT